MLSKYDDEEEEALISMGQDGTLDDEQVRSTRALPHDAPGMHAPPARAPLGVSLLAAASAAHSRTSRT